MNINDFKNLWDGSEPGWVVRMFTSQTWHLTFLFSPLGPDARQITLLRQLVPELMSLSLPAVHLRLKGKSSYQTRENYGSIDGHRLQNRAKKLGFHLQADVIENVSYLAIRDGSFVAVIEDDGIAAAVALKMIESGVPVQEVHSD